MLYPMSRRTVRYPMRSGGKPQEFFDMVLFFIANIAYLHLALFARPDPRICVTESIPRNSVAAEMAAVVQNPETLSK